MAYEIYFSKYYKDNIPLINNKSIFNDIKSSYYGGITEVYKPYGENLYYYDVNSLYPYVALNDMPGLDCIYKEFISPSKEMDVNIKDIFGFYYCEVETPKDIYLGLLPIRNNAGLFSPEGNWSGWYFSEEIKFAQDNGYKLLKDMNLVEKLMYLIATLMTYTK